MMAMAVMGSSMLNCCSRHMPTPVDNLYDAVDSSENAPGQETILILENV